MSQGAKVIVWLMPKRAKKAHAFIAYQNAEPERMSLCGDAKSSDEVAVGGPRCERCERLAKKEKAPK